MLLPPRMMTKHRSLACCILVLLVSGIPPLKAGPSPQTLDPAPFAESLRTLIRSEMASWEISGISIALVHDQHTILSESFGEARPGSVFRCGSISKLFTALSVMQLVEQGKLDLDAPVERSLPGTLPVNPFTNTALVTLRQILCHRSGLIRESAAGGYLDPEEVGLEQTIRSLHASALVNPPNTRTRYSNVGPTVAGYLVQQCSGMPFPAYQQRYLLDPLGMKNSSWARSKVPRGTLVPAHLRVADGKGGFQRQSAPVFDLGTIPAGNLFTTVDDLARFVSMLAAEGNSPGGRIIQPASLAQMWTPQLTSDPTGFGLGFMVSSLHGQKAVSHSGAVYGHSSSLVFLPDARLGVVVLGNEDIVNARIQNLAHSALKLMLNATGQLPPAPAEVSSGSPPNAELAGEYESQSFWASLSIRGVQLVGNISGQFTTFTPSTNATYLANSRVNLDVPVAFKRDARGTVTGFSLGAQNFERAAFPCPAIPRPWRAYLGAYGPRFIPLIISERHGKLYAMTENMLDYRLTPLNRNVFAFPPGLYTDEHVVFLAKPSGRVPAVNMANMVLRRIGPLQP